MTRAPVALLCGILLGACGEREKVTLPAIDVASAADGIVPLPESAPELFRRHFVKYAHVVAPNGKPIRILAQSGWTNDQIRHAREVLEYILTDHPGSAYGDDKSDIANAMADRNATLVLFDTEPALIEAMEAGLEDSTTLSMQDLRANESPAVGDPDYMDHVTRDAAYEEIWHLVHDYGIEPTRPAMVEEMRRANDTATENGWNAWPDDEPWEHPNEYVGVLLDNYLDLWALHPTKYEARPIEPGEIPDGHSHFGRYFANSRDRMRELDPMGYTLVEKFFAPYLTYTPELPVDFTGTFSMRFDPELRYTFKSRHLRSAALTGSNHANLVGNEHDNVLKGNAGDNVLDGGDGLDTAVYSGPASDYEIARRDDVVTVLDGVADRDGTDTLRSIEALRFRDRTLTLDDDSLP